MTVNGNTLGQWALLGSFILILYYCFRIIEPFLMPIFLALILSTLLTPIYDSLARRLNGRQNVAALLVCIGLTLAILLPLLLLSTSLVHEATQVFEKLRDPGTISRLQAWLDPARNPLLSKFRSWLPASI